MTIHSGNNAVVINKALTFDGNNTNFTIGEKNNPANVTLIDDITLAGGADNKQTLTIFAKKITAPYAIFPLVYVSSLADAVKIYQHPDNFKDFLSIDINVLNTFKHPKNVINAITIYTPADLQAINTNPKANYIVMNDINLGSQPFTTIKTFSGMLMGDKSQNQLPIISRLNVVDTATANGIPQVPAFIGRLTGGIQDIIFGGTNAMIVREMDAETPPKHALLPVMPLIKNVLVTQSTIVVSTGANADTFDKYGIGSLVGTMNGGIIDSAGVEDSSLSVYQAPAVGGLVGYVTNGNINHSATKMHITVNSGVNQNSNVGGLIGMVNGRVRVQYSTSLASIIAGAANLGGLIGTVNSTYNYPGRRGNSIIQDSSSQATVSDIINAPWFGARNIGGFIGSSNVPIIRTYSTSKVVAPANAGPSNVHVGGFAGVLNADVQLSHWDTYTSGYTQAAGIANTAALPAGDTDKEMRQIATYAGWDIQKINQDGSIPFSTWYMTPAQAYPKIGKFPLAEALWNKYQNAIN